MIAPAISGRARRVVLLIGATCALAVASPLPGQAVAKPKAPGGTAVTCELPSGGPARPGDVATFDVYTQVGGQTVKQTETRIRGEDGNWYVVIKQVSVSPPSTSAPASPAVSAAR